MSRQVSATRPSGRGKRLHLGTKPGDLAPHCIAVGDPKRARLIARKYLTNVRRVGNNRGLISFTGEYHGIPMSVITHGMGTVAAAVFREAAECGARYFIRVGSCSTFKKDANVGDIAIPKAAALFGGVGDAWGPREWQGSADHRMIAALVEAATELGATHHVGVGATVPDFYEWQGRPFEDDELPPWMQDILWTLTARQAVAFEMETGILFKWCDTHGDPGRFWAGSVTAIYGHRPKDALIVGAGDDNTIAVALRAMELIATRYPLAA